MFKRAIIKLTTWYVLIIMLVSLSFSTFMYSNVVHNTKNALDFQQTRLERRLEQFQNEREAPMPGGRMFKIPDFNEETLLEIREQVFTSLLLVNISIFFISSILGYFLAKITLKPIDEVLNKQKWFISSAAHDLKTPLTAIRTNLEVTLRNKKLNLAEAKKTMSEAIEEVDSLNYFTNKLLIQSKYSLNPKLLLKKTNISKVIADVVKSLNSIANQKQIKIKVTKDEKNIYALANHLSLIEAITNIVENAIKYSKPKSNILVTYYKKNNFVYIKIKDFGIGINKHNLNNVFEPFFREDEARKKTTNQSHGLGLTITKEILKNCGGNIKLLSKPNIGTTVIIKIPNYNKS